MFCIYINIFHKTISNNQHGVVAFLQSPRDRRWMHPPQIWKPCKIGFIFKFYQIMAVLVKANGVVI